MDLNSMNLLFSLITLGFGLYCLYAWFQMRNSDKIPEKFALLSRDLLPEKCIDQEVYLSFMRPRLLIFSVAMVVFGVISVVDDKLDLIRTWFPDHFVIISLLVTSLIPLGFIVWFAVAMYKIQKELW